MAEARVALGQTQLGSVFDSSEIVSIPVKGIGSHVAWTVTDAFGRTLASGRVALARGRAIIKPPPAGRGLFVITVAAEQGGPREARATTHYAVVAPPRARPAASRFGVMTHFAQGWDTDIVKLIAKAGIGHVRDEQYWEEIESRPGRYEFPAGFTRYMTALAEARLEPLLDATFANPLFDQGRTPYSDRGREGYGRYVATLARRYQGQVHAIEIWNEYNGTWCEGPCTSDRPRFYGEMLKRAYTEAKQLNPELTVVGGATVLIPLPFFEALFNSGALDFMDAVSVHPYRSVPEGVEKDINALRGLIRVHNGGRDKPIWATEIGSGETTNRLDVARYLTRMITLLLSADVQRVYWYLMRDYQDFVGMGLLGTPDSELGRYAPMPAYAAYATLIAELEGLSFVRREVTDPRTRAYLFDDGERSVRVIWSTSGEAWIDLATTARLRVVDMVGGETTLSPAHGSVSILASADPVFIVGPVTTLSERRDDRLIADSVADFGMTQGAHSWRYGGFYGDDASRRHLPAVGTVLPRNFMPLEAATNAWSTDWEASDIPELRIDADMMHPSVRDGKDVWAVRRWVSTLAGRIRVTGSATKSDSQGDGTWLIVLLDDTVIAAAQVDGANAPKPVTFDLSVEVRVGSRLDFAITPGPAGDINFDATSLTALITTVKQ